MNIFKSKLNEGAKSNLPIDPVELYKRCRFKEEYGYLRATQQEVLTTWNSTREQRDIICKMSTGSGKTLVGLLMLYSKMIETKLPSLYLCPDKHLVDQTFQQAQLYGIPVCLFEEENNHIPLKYKNAEAILITTFHKLFNGLSVFIRDNIQIGAILIDDAHKCLDIARTQATISVDRDSELGNRIFQLFSDDLNQQAPGAYRLLELGDPMSSTYKVPYWSWLDKHTSVIKIITEKIKDPEILYKWKFFENQSLSYDCYINGSKIEISPIHVPIQELKPFHEAKHRYILSATFEDDYDLIKDLNIDYNSVLNPINPKNSTDVGKRLILSPKRFDSKLQKEEIYDFISNYPKKGYNTVVLVSSTAKAKIWETYGGKIVLKENISNSIDKLKISNDNFLIFVGRYEGVDLHNNLCRVLVLDGLPAYDSLRERYLESKLDSFFASKKAQIIEQGLGRSTRSGGDYSVIYLLNDDLISFVGYKEYLNYFTPTTKKQLEIGLELLETPKEENSLKVIEDTANLCLVDNEDWHDYHVQKMDEINSITSNTESRKKLLYLAKIEVEAMEKFYKKQYIQSGNYLNEHIINANPYNLKEKERGWYFQLIAQLLYLGDKDESNNMQVKASEETIGLLTPVNNIIIKKLKPVKAQSSALLEAIKEYDRIQDYYYEVDRNLNLLQYNPDITSNEFEQSLAMIGHLIGFYTMQPEKETGNGPDVLWALSNDVYLILEAKSQAIHKEITRDNINQLLGSVEWFKTRYPYTKYIPVTLQPVKVKNSKVNISDDMRVWDLDALQDFKSNVRTFASTIVNIENINKEKIEKLIISNKILASEIPQRYFKIIVDSKKS
ncbi:DEAD/DEAH box helicase [Mucilaginibacter aquariorum]|uniref:DEAD/DEAH box helicase n=1 Tax=Mucilaginibacter aquariorum TaxID=2967225 RepID=A0ABT1T6L8_9SPHI|nr:DEAD/DEAH box helicase [Mucilaginibacter aquariorum]MCQ6959558.1 DEAD/DEAH box helicase [Mucilaginibacter aquariorum]